MIFDWEVVEFVARQTGQGVCIGNTNEYTRSEKAAMSQEAKKRNCMIRYGNPERDPEERSDELYVMAKL